MPLIVKIPMKIVRIIPCNQTVDFFTILHKLDNFDSVEILFVNCNTKVIKINGIITFIYILGINIVAPRIIGP